MQIIVNTFIRWNGGIVMLQKPRRGWWVLPGGKVETGEMWPDAARREVLEETGLHVANVRLAGVHLIHILGVPPEPATSRMIAQFVAASASGSLVERSKEGIVRVITEEELDKLPMDAGDKLMLQHTLWMQREQESNVFFGKFTYTSNHELVNWTVVPQVALQPLWQEHL